MIKEKENDDEVLDSDIIWTYSVTWRESDVKWACRWDIYLKMNNSSIHWLSIGNSCMIVLFLSGMVAMILLRTLRADLARYNVSQDPEKGDDFDDLGQGWKMVHGDVFRAPLFPNVFAIFVGTGVQILGMAVCTIFFAMIGLLSPSNRGGLMTALLVLFVLLSGLAGYHSTRLYLMFGLQHWAHNALYTACFFPGVVFGTFFALNFLIWENKSSGAVPFPTMVSLVVLWVFISLPLVLLGAFMAKRAAPFVPPTRVSREERRYDPDRPTPLQANKWLAFIVGGLLPFASCFIEVFFIMSSLWQNQYYYMFGCLFLVVLILVVTCAEIAIVCVYFQLCNEDHHWWWRAFLAPASSAVYLGIYSIFYFFNSLDLTTLVSALMYFGYMWLASVSFFLLTGTIGYFACMWFVKTIFSQVKID